MQLMQHRSEEDYMRHTHDKDVMLKKYQEQADDVLRLKNNCNCLIEQKARLEEELNNLYGILYLEHSLSKRKDIKAKSKLRNLPFEWKVWKGHIGDLSQLKMRKLDN